jgi:hypothetical protein
MPQQNPTAQSNISAFLEAAREAKADETEEGADKAFKAVVSPKKKPKSSLPRL